MYTFQINKKYKKNIYFINYKCIYTIFKYIKYYKLQI